MNVVNLSHYETYFRACLQTSKLATISQLQPHRLLFFFNFVLTESPIVSQLGADYMRRAGPVNRAGSVCRDFARLLNTLKIDLAITWKNLSPASWDPGIAMPGSRLHGLKS